MYQKSQRQLYREWSASDLGIYLILRACSPEQPKKKERKKLQERGLDNKWLGWAETLQRSIIWADHNKDIWRESLYWQDGRGQVTKMMPQ